jgi:hypothetical protein
MGIKDYLGAMPDYVGDADMLGMPVRGLQRHRNPHLRNAYSMLHQPMAGVPNFGPREEPIGVAPVGANFYSFTAASGLTLTGVAQPQKAFKGRRLILDIARTGATSTGLVFVVDIKVGQRPVPVSAQPVGAGAFGATAFGVDLMLDTAVPGIIITIVLSISSAPTTTDTVNVSGTIIGLTWS